ncbi:MAG: two pore domain potassium channel family protein [Bacteroidetes bacterium]|nr:two pore domain potassium channel family protein [Bacteroidota bacterium]
MKLKDRLKKELKWNSEEYGILTPSIMFFFRLLQFLPFQLFYGNKTDYYYKELKGKSTLERKEIAKKRAIFMEKVILSYMAIEILMPFIYENYLHVTWFKYVISIVLALRLIDIIQVNVNMILFDSIRTEGFNRITKYTRAILLIIWNYFELILIFGFFYLSNHEALKGFSTWTDSYYFSTITQLTIGYGDLSPTGNIRFITAFQGFVGTMFMAFIISKIISLVPELKEMDKE